MESAAADARNNTTPAMCSGGTHSAKFAPGIAVRLGGVSMMLGRMQLTFTPWRFSSSAKVSVKRITTLLEATYAAILAAPRNAPRAPMLTILPPPRSAIPGAAARHMFSTVRALRFSMKSQVSSDVSATLSPMVKPPAMLARMSTGPAAATAAAAPAGSMRSATSVLHGAVCSATSTPVTRAPASWNRCATTLPTVPAAPVTSTFLFANSVI